MVFNYGKSFLPGRYDDAGCDGRGVHNVYDVFHGAVGREIAFYKPRYIMHTVVRYKSETEAARGSPNTAGCGCQISNGGEGRAERVESL